MKRKFKTGREIMTRGVADWCDDETYFKVLACLVRHIEGDWGEVCKEDWASNDAALKNGDRLLSAYTVNGKLIWIITEWDRSATTILFPDEY